MRRSREAALLVRPSLPLGTACLVRSDSPRLLRNWRVCHPVFTHHCCAPAFLAGCGTRSARHAAPLFRDGRLASTDCHAVNHAATRRPQRPSGPALRGFGSREGGTNRVFGGGCQPRRATDVSASETWWSERVRAARARGRERTSAEQLLAPWWSERVRAARGRGRERTARSEHLRPRAREDER